MTVSDMKSAQEADLRRLIDTPREYDPYQQMYRDINQG